MELIKEGNKTIIDTISAINENSINDEELLERLRNITDIELEDKCVKKITV